MSDRALGADRSDRGDFVEFYELQWAETVRLAGFLAGDRTVAEDLAQEALVRVRPEFERLERPGAYLRTTLVNVCRNYRRSMERERRRLTRQCESAGSLSDAAAELNDTLARLPYEQRAVVVLRYWLGLSEDEIAGHLGCRPGTVKSRHARALKRLRKDLM